MTTSPDHNPYPRTDPNGTSNLTKRECFAAMAMQGLLVNATENRLGPDGVSRQAVQVADRLIAALNGEL